MVGVEHLDREKRKALKARKINAFKAFLKMEVRGIEPLSEDSVVWFSPSADRVLTFPPACAPCRA